MRVDYRVNARGFLTFSDCMYMGTRAWKYWEGWKIRNYIFDKMFFSEAQKGSVLFEVFQRSQHWTVGHWRASPRQVTVTEMYCQVRSEPGAGGVITVLAVALRGSIRRCKHYQTKIPADAVNPNDVLESQQYPSLSLRWRVPEPSLGGWGWIAPLCWCHVSLQK